MRRTGRRACLTALTGAVLAASAVLVAPITADAAAVPLAARERGNDVSYPQCGGPLPTGGDFGIVGVDGGKPFDANPCLAEQIVWARTSGRPAYYLNTANPGPKLSGFWPLGQRSPQHCTRSRPDSAACAFDYGWNAAKDSLARAKAAAASVGAPDVTRTNWWLDVEMHNTWESLEYGERPMFLRNDTAVLRGMAALLHRRGVRTVGVYSTVHQWQHCARSWSFTGGPVRLSQFLRDGYDADFRC